MGWQAAIAAWRDIVGSAHVDDSKEACGIAGRATFATTPMIHAIVSPADREELQHCMAVAQRYQCPVYPVSKGKNWGLGSRVPTSEESALFSLHRMDRITAFDEELGYMTLEPGVTFRQVHQWLQTQQSQRMLSVIGGSPDASIIGNVAERGDGIGPYGDRLNRICALEVVLPDGTLLHTGMGRFPGAHAQYVSQWGVGPSMEGLFTQSNLGIITQMTVWLQPKPPWFQLFVAELCDREGLAGLLDVLQPLVQHGIVQPNALHLWNGYKLLARKGRYPWSQLPDGPPLTPALLPDAARWYACGSHYCPSKAHGDADRDAVELAVGPYVDRLTYMDQSSHPQIRNDNPMLGIPYDDNIASTYWRKREAPPEQMDPDRDLCGVLWLCPVFPFRGMLIEDAIAMVTEIITAYGFEPNLGLTCASPRAIRMFIALVYDREREGRDEAAMACHDALFQALLERGHLPCRLGIQSMQQLPPGEGAYTTVLSQIKQILDPQRILAPGRYQWEPPCSKKSC